MSFSFSASFIFFCVFDVLSNVYFVVYRCSDVLERPLLRAPNRESIALVWFGGGLVWCGLIWFGVVRFWFGLGWVGLVWSAAWSFVLLPACTWRLSTSVGGAGLVLRFARVGGPAPTLPVY